MMITEETKNELSEIEKMLWQVRDKLVHVEAKKDVNYKTDKHLRFKVELHILKAIENLQKIHH